MKCPDCSQGFPYPQLRQSGNGTNLICPVCRTHFDARGREIPGPETDTEPDTAEESMIVDPSLYGGYGTP